MDAPMLVDDHETFGARLRRLMLARGFNQARLAKRTGIDRTVVNRLISGKAKPRPEHVGWLSVALGVDEDELTAGGALSTDVRRAIDHVRAGAERLLRTETERDAARELATQLAAELRRERAERELERARLAQAEANQALLRQRVARLERQLSAQNAVGSQQPTQNVG